MAGILTRHGHAVRALHIEDPAELLGINTRVELADADRILRQRKARELMLSGVTIERPETVASTRPSAPAPTPSSSRLPVCWGRPASARTAASERGPFLKTPNWPTV